MNLGALAWLRMNVPAKLAGFMIAAVAGVAGGLVFTSLEDMPDIVDLGRYTASPATRLYDNGTPPELISQLAIEQRTFVPMTRMPRALLDAIVAIEDERFYSHWGLDLWGIARATVVNLISRRVKEGGSTITQQLARTLFLTQERTLQRKIKEAFLAFQIERKYKKEEILEMYLNQIYLGHGAYGVEQAARTYFGKHIEELTLPECAMLAGIPRSPTNYSPRVDMAKGLARRALVLQKMVDRGFVPKEEADEAAQAPLQLRQTETKNAPYFAAHVRQYLENTYGSQAVYRGGLSVLTTLNQRYQTIAQKAVEQGLESAERLVHSTWKPGSQADAMRLQAALVAMDPRTGAILAMVGGRNFQLSEFNRATQAKRQPGSSFKPYIYVTSLMNGFRPSDIIDDSPLQFTGRDGKAWQPSNFERKFFGPTSLRRALSMSRNVVTAKLLNKVGVRTVIAQARHFGFAGPFREDLTLALGTSEVGLLEAVSAFSVYANGGIRAEPYAIKLVKDGQGNILEQHRPSMASVVPPQVAYQMISILQDTIDFGTARVVRRLGFTRPAAGKTGSTNDFTDAWFVGATPSLVCGVWVGYDDRRSLGKNMTGGLIAAPVWASFMAEALEGAPREDFVRPSGLVTVAIDPTSGLLAGKECRRVVSEVFVEGNVPTQLCDRHGAAKPFSQEDLEQLEQTLTPTGGTVREGSAGRFEPDDAAGQQEGF
jgi:penicillin-binding protein 1A